MLTTPPITRSYNLSNVLIKLLFENLACNDHLAYLYTSRSSRDICSEPQPTQIHTTPFPKCSIFTTQTTAIMFVSIHIDIAVNIGFFLTLALTLGRIILFYQGRRGGFVASDSLSIALLVCIAVAAVSDIYIKIHGYNSSRSFSKPSLCSVTDRKFSRCLNR